MPKPVWPGDLLATDQADAASVQSRTKPLFNALNPSMLADNGDPDGGVDDTMVSDGAIGKEKINQTAAVLTQGGLNTANFQQIKGPFSVGGTVNKGMLLFATALEIPDGSAFPDVSGGNVFITNNTASTSILGFTGGEAELLSPDQTAFGTGQMIFCLLYTSPSPRDRTRSRMPSSA